MAKFKVGDKVVMNDDPKVMQTNLVDHWKKYWEHQVGPYQGYFYITKVVESGNCGVYNYSTRPGCMGPQTEEQFLKLYEMEFKVGSLYKHKINSQFNCYHKCKYISRTFVLFDVYSPESPDKVVESFYNKSLAMNSFEEVPPPPQTGESFLVIYGRKTNSSSISHFAFTPEERLRAWIRKLPKSNRKNIISIQRVEWIEGKGQEFLNE